MPWADIVAVKSVFKWGCGWLHLMWCLTFGPDTSRLLPLIQIERYTILPGTLHYYLGDKGTTQQYHFARY